MFLWVDTSVPNYGSLGIHFVIMFGLGVTGVGSTNMSMLINPKN
jgi:hypothetical protein